MNQQYKSGFATLIGRPNVGKSTLMNHLIGQKIAITSNKPQTTRNRIQTVYTSEEGQIVFVDTPGIHKAKNKLGEYMVTVAERTLSEVDVILWLVEPTTFIGAGEQHIAEQLRKTKTPIILVINKIDTVKREEILKSIDAYKDICDFAEIVPCSALKGDNTEDLIKVIMKYLPYGPQFYDEDTIQHHITTKVILLSGNSTVLGVMTVSESAHTYDIVETKFILQAAILANAKSIIVVSNSPSGDLEPNDAEKDLKNQIKLAAYLFDIELADYLLINKEDYYSFADNKVL